MDSRRTWSGLSELENGLSVRATTFFMVVGFVVIFSTSSLWVRNEMMSGMAEGMYLLHYHEKISDNLSSECKLSVLNRISDLTLRNPIWLDRDKDYRQDFPEVAPYISKGIPLSGLYLVAIMKGLLSDIQSH